MQDFYVRPTKLEAKIQRRERLLRDAAIRRVECPRCGAGIGEDCSTPGVWSVAFHKARVEAAGQRWGG